jgi:hypothetical protein
MVTFRDSMDPHSVDVVRGATLVAYLHWHPGREPRVVTVGDGVHEFTTAEVRAMLEELAKRVAEWVRAETARALEPIQNAFTEKRWPVQGQNYANPEMGLARPKKPAGTVSDGEARLAYEAYARRHGREQSFERTHERGGFGYWELTDLLGHEPTTWREGRE